MIAISPIFFRTLNILSLVLVLIGALIDPFIMHSVHIAHSVLAPWANPGFFVPMAAINFSIGVISTAGLFFFRRWSRPLSIISIALSVINYSAFSYFAVSGVTTAVDFLAALAGGATLALAYFSPIAKQFETSNSPEQPFSV